MTDVLLTDRQRENPRLHRAPDARQGLSAVGAGDRRGGRAHLALHRPQPPQHAAAPRLPASATPPSPGPSRCATTPSSGRPSSAGRCATCRSWATSPPAPTCSPRRTSRSSSRCPADFTGDGELFMLRVRGDSMIDAGILDGDFVVARHRPPPTTATSWWPASPTSEATVKTFQRKGAKVVLAPVQRSPVAHGVRRRPTSRSSAGSSPFCAASDQFDERRVDALIGADGLDALVGGVGEQGVAGAEVDRRDAVRGEAGDVGPTELGAHRYRWRSTRRASSGWSSPGGAPGATSTTSTTSSPLEIERRSRRARGASASAAVAIGGEAVVDHEDGPSGTTLPATPPSTRTACSASRYSHPSITGRRPS